MDQNPFTTVVEKLESWLEGFIAMLPNLVAAVLILIGFWLLAKVVRRVVRRVMDRVSSYRQVNGLLATIAYIAVLTTGAFIALGVLDLDKTVTSLLAGAGIIGLALGFAFQDIAANFISGIFMSIRRPFREGEIVKTNDFFGTVEEITLRSTLMRTFQGQQVIVPNSQVFQNPLVNYSRLGRQRIDLGCGVAYGDDLEQAREVALKAIKGLDIVNADKPVDLYYNEFGDSSINFTLRFWVDFNKQTDFLGARSEAIIALKKAFDEAGITIPFPIRTLDFGVVGGVNLDEVLPGSLYEQQGKDGAQA